MIYDRVWSHSIIEGFVVLSWCSGWYIWGRICFTQREGFRILVHYRMRFAKNVPVPWEYPFEAHITIEYKNPGSLIGWWILQFTLWLNLIPDHLQLYTMSITSSAVLQFVLVQLFSSAIIFCSAKLSVVKIFQPPTWLQVAPLCIENIWRMMGWPCGRGSLLICTYVGKFSLFVIWAPWIFNLMLVFKLNFPDMLS